MVNPVSNDESRWTEELSKIASNKQNDSSKMKFADIISKTRETFGDKKLDDKVITDLTAIHNTEHDKLSRKLKFKIPLIVITFVALNILGFLVLPFIKNYYLNISEEIRKADADFEDLMNGVLPVEDAATRGDKLLQSFKVGKNKQLNKTSLEYMAGGNEVSFSTEFFFHPDRERSSSETQIGVAPIEPSTLEKAQMVQEAKRKALLEEVLSAIHKPKIIIIPLKERTTVGQDVLELLIRSLPEGPVKELHLDKLADFHRGNNPIISGITESVRTKPAQGDSPAKTIVCEPKIKKVTFNLDTQPLE